MASNNPPEVTIKLLKLKDLSTACQNKVEQPTDFLLLTSGEHDFLSCLSVLNPGFMRSYLPELGYVYFGDVGGDGATKVKIALMQTRGTSCSVCVDASCAVQILKPKGLISVGHCASLNRTKAKLGDVVVSGKLVTYAHIKVTADGIEDRGDRVPVTKGFADLIDEVVKFWKAPLHGLRELDLKVHSKGELLSGPELVRSPERCAQLTSRYPTAVAIEQGGEGVYEVAHSMNLHWLIVKGISGYADGRGGGKAWNMFASAMAASLTAHILTKKPILFQRWHRYEGQGLTYQIRRLQPGFHTETDDVYKMTSSPRGIALIINNKEFLQTALSPRLGSDVDVLRVESLFESLNFKVKKKINLTRDEVLEQLKKVARKDHSAYDCFVLWLMSHGDDNDQIFGIDAQPVRTREIRDIMCRSFKGKPKLFFFQACRGSEQVFVQDAPGRNNSSDSRADYTDFLMAYSAVEGFASYRNGTTGSVFVQTVVEVFCERHGDCPINVLLQEVSGQLNGMKLRVEDEEGNDKYVKPTFVFKNNLTKQLYF